MTAQRALGVVVASGGMDSCVAAAVAKQTHDLAFLHVNYGQRTETRELTAFHALADHFGAIQRLVIAADYFRRIGGSALTDEALAVPTNTTHSDLPTTNESRIPITYVPFRNANILAMATSWAEVLGATRIFIGAVEEDSSGYPDCRESFLEAFNRVIAEGTRPETEIRIQAPLLHLSKGRIVRLGLDLQAPLHLTWSCYSAEDRACGKCDSCLLRLKGFAEAGATDPIPYRET